VRHSFRFGLCAHWCDVVLQRARCVVGIIRILRDAVDKTIMVQNMDVLYALAEGNDDGAATAAVRRRRRRRRQYERVQLG